MESKLSVVARMYCRSDEKDQRSLARQFSFQARSCVSELRLALRVSAPKLMPEPSLLRSVPYRNWPLSPNSPLLTFSLYGSDWANRARSSHYMRYLLRK